ncbi:MAG: glycosyltransferase family 2 protein [Acidimicrobiales bacterium]
MSRPGLREAAVVVPARNEEGHIGRCLDALEATCRACPVPSRIVVVLDSCTDGTAAVAARSGVDVLAVRHGNVGRARDAGARLAIRRSTTSPDRLWLASTDADSWVQPDWLAFMVAAADAGADLVLGTVRPETPDALLLRAWAAAHHLRDGHRHVHGANLGVRASTYTDVGGYPPADTAEDVALAARINRCGGAVVLSTGEVPVLTSGRLVGRAPGGLAAYLRALGPAGATATAGTSGSIAVGAPGGAAASRPSPEQPRELAGWSASVSHVTAARTSG